MAFAPPAQRPVGDFQEDSVVNKASRKKLCLAILLAAAVMLLASCAGQPAQDTPAETDRLSQIRQRGTLVIGTEGTWSPWTYHDENSHELTGLDIEIGTLIAHGLGVEPDFQETDWDAILAGVESGRFDIACNGVGFTKDRAEKYEFSTPYVYTPKVLVVRGDNEDIHSLEDLKGRTTANTPSSTYATLAKEHGATVTPVNSLGETMELLIYGRVDATINAKVSVEDYMTQHPDADIKVVQELPGDPVAYPVRKGETALINAINEILDKARQDGTLSAISLKYFGEDRTKPE
ncbi:MAG: transporter substrate-binding domain-containing protein [Clostridia bacterium]|nr:transporter substrate-binding domain-containing protein [Clostridia bacterium]